MAVNISNIDFIIQLKQAILLSGEKALQQLPTIRSFIQQKKVILTQAMCELEHRLADAETKLSNQNNMLTLCKSRVEYNDEGKRITPNCSSEENAVRRAKVELKAARNNLDEMKQIVQIIEELLSKYDKALITFESLNTDFTESCAEYLSNIIELFNQYIALSDEYTNV